MKAIVRLTKTVTLEIEELTDMETLHKAIVLTHPRRFCNVCMKKDAKKYYTSNKDREGNIYVNFKCECGARSKLGQYKAGGYFWRDYEKFVKKGGGQNASTAAQPNQDKS